MATVQLNCRVEAAIAKRLRLEVKARHSTTGSLITQAIELLLSTPSGTVATGGLAALEARVAKLEANQGDHITLKNNDESRRSDRTSTNLRYYNNLGKSQSTTQGGSNTTSIVTPSQGLTTAELAIQTSTNKAAWNTWASKAAIGNIRHHPQAGSWRLIGKAPSNVGGPARWLWEQTVGEHQQTSDYATTTSATALPATEASQ